MTFARFLVLWAPASFVVALLVGRAIAMGRLKGKPCHLLTARQAAAEVGVSHAAVASWQRDGLLSSETCTICGAAGIPPAAVAALTHRADASVTAGWRTELVASFDGRRLA